MEKILFVTNDFPPQSGGIQTFIEGLIKELPHGCVVVHTSSFRDPDAQERYDQLLLHERGTIVVRDRQRILLPTPALRKRVAGTIHAHEIKTVVFGASVPLGLMAPTLRRAGVERIIAITHGHEVWWSKVPLFSALLRKVGRDTDHLTYLGSFTRRAISKALNEADRGKLIALPPGVDVRQFAPGVKSERLIERYEVRDKTVILCVGRLVQRKGQDLLIKAMAQVTRKYPQAHLLIAGVGNYEARLKKLSEKLGMTEHISFLGRVPYEELPDLFRVADIFASPTRDRFGGLEVEGLGIVYLEASASGIPVIAGRSGGSPDAVQPGASGLVVDGRKVDELVNALELLLVDDAKRIAMGASGRRWMESQWSWQVIGARFRRLLELD